MRNPTTLRTIFASATLVLALASRAATVAQQSAPQIPSQLLFLPSLGEVRKNLEYEKWGEKKFPSSDTAKRGQHWTLLMDLRPFTDRQANWAAMKPTFLKNGWTVVKESGTGSSVITLSSTQNGAEAWVAVDMDPTVKIDVVLVGPVPVTLALAAPAATPEKMEAAKGDFPYLVPMPGSKFHSGSQDPSPFWVFPQGASQKEMVAPASLVRSYSLPDLSNLMFMTVYRDALTKAGWEIADEFWERTRA